MIQGGSHEARALDILLCARVFIFLPGKGFQYFRRQLPEYHLVFIEPGSEDLAGFIAAEEWDG